MRKILYLFLFVLFTVSCEDDELLIVTFGDTEIIAIKSTSVESMSTIFVDGDKNVDEYGVCWATNENPTIEDNFLAVGNGEGQFKSLIENLQPATTYYIRVYAKGDGEVKYSKAISVTTFEDEENMPLKGDWRHLEGWGWEEYRLNFDLDYATFVSFTQGNWNSTKNLGFVAVGDKKIRDLVRVDESTWGCESLWILRNSSNTIIGTFWLPAKIVKVEEAIIQVSSEGYYGGEYYVDSYSLHKFDDNSK